MKKTKAATTETEYFYFSKDVEEALATDIGKASTWNDGEYGPTGICVEDCSSRDRFYGKKEKVVVGVP